MADLSIVLRVRFLDELFSGELAVRLPLAEGELGPHVDQHADREKAGKRSRMLERIALWAHLVCRSRSDRNRYVVAKLVRIAGFIPNPPTVSKLVSIRIDIARLGILQSNSKDSQLAQRVEFGRLADSIVIGVDPDAKIVVNAISGIDYAIAVAAVHRIVE